MTFDIGYTLATLEKVGITALPEQAHLLERYVDLLLQWNERVNLISRKEHANVWRNHILHSLAGLTVFDIHPGERVLDVGTGGGLPGIPLAILRPDAEYVLLDSIAKKTRAVAEIAAALGLTHVATVTDRVEERFRNCDSGFDLVLTRAVARLATVIGWCLPAVNPGARLMAWKGGDLTAELEEAAQAYPACTIERTEFRLGDELYFRNEDKCLVAVTF